MSCHLQFKKHVVNYAITFLIYFLEIITLYHICRHCNIWMILVYLITRFRQRMWPPIRFPILVKVEKAAELVKCQPSNQRPWPSQREHTASQSHECVMTARTSLEGSWNMKSWGMRRTAAATRSGQRCLQITAARLAAVRSVRLWSRQHEERRGTLILHWHRARLEEGIWGL